MKIKEMFIKIRCFLSFHKWGYEQSYRTCKYCGKKQVMTYDMMYGETYWVDY